MIGGRMFAVGGTVQAAGDEVLYVERAADDTLFNLSRRGGIVAVIGPRQIGKSSLLIHAMVRLLASGASCVFYDLQSKGSSTASQLYLDLVSDIDRQLHLDPPLERWWKTHDRLDLPERFAKLMSEVLSSSLRQPFILFIDEIDSMLEPLREEFFSLVPLLCEGSEAGSPLTVVLSGRASVRQLETAGLATDRITTIDLPDFTAEQLSAVASALCLEPETSRMVRDRVYWWTSGHPYLSMRIFAELAESGRLSWSADDVDDAVRACFDDQSPYEDSNLLLLHQTFQQPSRAASLLSAYQAIRASGRLSDRDSELAEELLLSGLITEVDGTFRVRNRLYTSILGDRWIQSTRSTIQSLGL